MRWIIGLALAFAIVIGANAAMVYFAVTTPNPIVDSYNEGVR
jgi:hypothetical protein